MITSLRNDRVRYVQALQKRRRVRQRERRFVFEGVRLVDEAVRSGVEPAFVFYAEPGVENERSGALLKSLRGMGVPCHPVSQSVLSACSDTETPQPILAVMPIPDHPRPHHPTLSLIVDGVRDPGNLGTMLRTALAAGVEQVLLAPGTVDASNPKAVRAAMGAQLHVPVAALRWRAIAKSVVGASVWVAAADSTMAYTEVDWTEPLALIVGGEGAGVSDLGRSLAQRQVSISMAAGVESLNTAIATAVILFEIRRQRGASRP